MTSLRESFDEWKEGSSPVLLQSGLNERWRSDSMKYYCYLRNVKDLLTDGEKKTSYERRFGESFEGSLIPFGVMTEYHPISARNQSSNHQFDKKVFIVWDLSCLWADRGENVERRYFDSRSGRFGKVIRIRNLFSKNQRERSIDKTRRWRIHIPSSRWHSKIVRESPRMPSTHSETGIPRKEWRFQYRTSRQNQQMTLKPLSTSDRSRETSSIVI